MRGALPDDWGTLLCMTQGMWLRAVIDDVRTALDDPALREQIIGGIKLIRSLTKDDQRRAA